MYSIINDGAIYYMSTIIGVCGVNFCSFAADGRRVERDNGEWIAVDEHCQKIVKLNDNVILGAAGVFEAHESITTPIDIHDDRKNITLDLAQKIVKDYMEKHKRTIYAFPRSYVVGGKDKNGEFCMYEIRCNFNTGDIDVLLRKSVPPQSNFALSILLPFGIIKDSQKYVDMMASCISSIRTHEQLLRGMSETIGAIADADETVNKEIYTITIM